MYKSSLRHIHDPVLSSLKMKGIFFSVSLGTLTAVVCVRACVCVCLCVKPYVLNKKLGFWRT
jgi:hypothetical protein